jgi:hypothetical protein
MLPYCSTSPEPVTCVRSDSETPRIETAYFLNLVLVAILRQSCQQLVRYLLLVPTLKRNAALMLGLVIDHHMQGLIALHQSLPNNSRELKSVEVYPPLIACSLVWVRALAWPSHVPVLLELFHTGHALFHLAARQPTEPRT